MVTWRDYSGTEIGAMLFCVMAIPLVIIAFVPVSIAIMARRLLQHGRAT